MKRYLYNQRETEQGFTIVETLVAIGILITAIAAPLTIAHTGLRSAHYAQDALTAQMLAIEGVEYIRNVRDDNYLDGRDWDRRLRVNQDPFLIDSVQDQRMPCSASGCQADLLSFNSDTKLYSYQIGGEWSESAYSRSIEVDRVSPTEVLITVTVWWTRKGQDHSYTTREYLLNWYE